MRFGQVSDWEGRPRVSNSAPVSKFVAVGEGTRNVTPAFDSVFTTSPPHYKYQSDPVHGDSCRRFATLDLEMLRDLGMNSEAKTNRRSATAHRVVGRLC